jgi:hypothetical protein
LYLLDIRTINSKKKKEVNKYGINNFSSIVLDTIDIKSKDIKPELIKSENKY